MGAILPQSYHPSPTTMFKTIFKAVASFVAKMAPHRCRAFASRSYRAAQLSKTLSPRADTILRNINCISNPTQSQNQYNNALTQLRLLAITKNESVVVLRKKQVKVLVPTIEGYCRHAQRWENIPELENSNLPLMHIKLGMHLRSEHWRWRGSTFVCVEGITKAQVRNWIIQALEGIDDQSIGVGINVIVD